MVTWLETESQIDDIAAVSGSGPAYFFAFMEAMQAKAEQLGFDADTAKALVEQTAMGAAKMALETDDSFAQLRQNVTSKGGTTAAALEVFQQQQLSTTVDQAMQAAKVRAEVLGEELTKTNSK